MKMNEHEHEYIKHRYVNSVWWDGGPLMVRKNQSEPLWLIYPTNYILITIVT